MIWIELLFVLTVLSAVVTVGVLSRRHAWRWGRELGPPLPAGAGPYRAGETRGERLRGTPRVVQWAAGTGIVWALLTLLLFMPFGFLLLLLLGQAHGAGLAVAFGAMLLLLVSCDALLLGFALLATVPALLRGGAEGGRAARNVARWSTVHHLLVLVAFFFVGVAEPDGVVVLALAFVPCLLGLSHAGLLERAAEACALADEAPAVTSARR